MPLLKRAVAQMIGFDGAYHRFTGKVAIEKFEKGLERFDDRAISGTDVFRQGVC
jgi:hypothetical protein